MIIREDTREELAAYVAAGRIDVGGGALRATLRHPRRAERGDPFEIAWRAPFAASVVLESTTPSGRLQVEVVPRRGRRSVRALRTGIFHFCLRAEPSRSRQRRGVPPVVVAGAVEVVTPPPRIEADVPAHGVAGETVRIEWAVAEADRISLEWDGQSHPVPARGERQLNCERCGEQRLAIAAAGEGGQRRREFVIAVVAPPVVIVAPNRVAVEAGEAAAIDYRVEGATAVFAETLGDGYPPLSVPALGCIETGGVMDGMRIRLSAVGRDGKVAARTIAVVANPLRFLAIDDELNLLNGSVP